MKKSIVCIFLAGCATTPPIAIENPMPSVLDDTCQAAQHAEIIGQDATALERVLRLGEVRVIRPGAVVTQDYRPERINFLIGRENKVLQITCG